MAVPAAAQVNGIGVTDPAIAIAGSQALQTAYQQIGTTYQAQRTQLEQLQQQRDALVRQFDTNGDGQLSEAEQAAAQANTTAVQQLQTLDQTDQPDPGSRSTLARVYVDRADRAAATAPRVQQVVAANNISADPDARRRWSTPPMRST